MFHTEKNLYLSPYTLTKLGVKYDGTKRGLSRDCNTRTSSPKKKLVPKKVEKIIVKRQKNKSIRKKLLRPKL